jgi:CDP-glycerol glycerophosphotransferase (TagB/SpsB family)
VPKNTNLWLFGAWFGEKYADNSKYLFEYVNRNHPNVRAVWLTRNAGTRDLVSRSGYEVHLMSSPQGLFLRALSGVWIVTTTHTTDVNIYYAWPFGRVKLVQLWHGTPLKTIGYDHKQSRMHPEAAAPRFQVLPFNALASDKDLYIAPSEEVRAKLQAAFRVPRDRIKVTGYPRTDALFAVNKPDVPLARELRALRKKSCVGIYLPTHRQEGKGSVSSLTEGLSAIDAKLGELGVALLVKPHFVDLNKLNILADRLTNVRVITDDDIDQDLYSVLSETDFLITDYSSVFFDYLLLDKPIIFAPFDKESYTIDRALYYNYEDVTPGPKARNWQEVLTYIEDVTTNREAYEEERRRVDRTFNAFHDGHSSQRVYDAITSELDTAPR